MVPIDWLYLVLLRVGGFELPLIINPPMKTIYPVGQVGGVGHPHFKKQEAVFLGDGLELNLDAVFLLFHSPYLAFAFPQNLLT